MLLRLIGCTDPVNIVIILFSYTVILFIVFPIHECAHALTAKWLGDTTAEDQGRISLNPMNHLDPFGTISILLFGIGWAKPVPVQPYRCHRVKSQKTAMALTSIAGPVSNVLATLVFIIIYKVLALCCPGDVAVRTGFSVFMVSSEVVAYVIVALGMIATINLSLGVFNLLPIPPFDGSRLFLAFLPAKYYFGIMKYERYIMYALMILLWTGILQIPLGFLADLIYLGLDFITGFLG